MIQVAFVVVVWTVIFVSIIDERAADKRTELIIATINDSGKATDYKLQEIVQRIDNYNLDSLKGNK